MPCRLFSLSLTSRSPAPTTEPTLNYHNVSKAYAFMDMDRTQSYSVAKVRERVGSPLPDILRTNSICTGSKEGIGLLDITDVSRARADYQMFYVGYCLHAWQLLVSSTDLLPYSEAHLGQRGAAKIRPLASVFKKQPQPTDKRTKKLSSVQRKLLRLAKPETAAPSDVTESPHQHLGALAGDDGMGKVAIRRAKRRVIAREKIHSLEKERRMLIAAATEEGQNWLEKWSPRMVEIKVADIVHHTLRSMPWEQIRALEKALGQAAEEADLILHSQHIKMDVATAIKDRLRSYVKCYKDNVPLLQESFRRTGVQLNFG